MNATFSRQALQPAFTWDDRDSDAAQFEVPEEYRSQSPRKMATYTAKAILPPPGASYPDDRKLSGKDRDNWRGQHYTPDDETLSYTTARHRLSLRGPDGERVASFIATPTTQGALENESVGDVRMTRLAANLQKRGVGPSLYLLAMHHLPYDWFHSKEISEEAEQLRGRMLERGLIEYHPDNGDLVRLTEDGHEHAAAIKEVHAAGVGFHTASWKYGANDPQRFSMQFASYHPQGATARSRSAVSRAYYDRLRAATGGEYGPDGVFRAGGKFTPGAQGPPPVPSGPAQQAVEDSGAYQPQGGGDEDYGQPIGGFGGGEEGGAMPQQGGGQQPTAQAPAPLPKPLREHVIDYHKIGFEPRHQVEPVKALFRQPTGDLPHPDDEHAWSQIAPEMIPGLLLHVLGANGHKFSEWFGKGVAQALGDDTTSLGSIPLREMLAQASMHPDIQDQFRRHSGDISGRPLSPEAGQTAAARTWWRTTRTLADIPEFGQKYGHAAAEAMIAAMQPPPNPDLQFAIQHPSQAGEPAPPSKPPLTPSDSEWWQQHV